MGWGRKDTGEKPRGRPREAAEPPRTSHGEARAQVRSGSERYVTNINGKGGGGRKEQKKHISVVLSPQKKEKKGGGKKKQARLKSECVEFHVGAQLELAEVFFFSAPKSKGMCAFVLAPTVAEPFSFYGATERFGSILYPFIPYINSDDN